MMEEGASILETGLNSRICKLFIRVSAVYLINFRVETDRGIKRQVCIIRDPDFPWVQMDVHNWESTVKVS